MSNIKNRTVYCKDNLDVLREIDDECVDMIYLDPPFNKNKSFHAPVGTTASGASFKDIFGSDDIDPSWMLRWGVERPELYHFIKNLYFFADKSDASYIQYMAVRIIECHRVLKDTGSIFYHCDDTMQHYIKIMMDIVFGRNQFKNEINWKRTTQHANGNKLGRITDAILFYTKSNNYIWNNVYIPKTNPETYYNRIETETGRRFTVNGLSKPSWGNETTVVFNGKEFKGCFQWRQAKIDEELSKNPYVIFETSGGKLNHKIYMDEDKGNLIQDFWGDITHKDMSRPEKLGYPTQKPLALLDRIIECSTNEGDMVLDPFCGCATACVSAENLNRQWIGIDISIKAYELVKQRLGATTGNIFSNEVQMTLETETPIRSEYRTEEKKWVYIVSNQAYPGEYKVGIATNPKSRLSSYQTSDPNMGYKMEFKVQVPNWLEIEKAVHNHFPNKREWVQAELKEIKEYINTLQNK